MKRSPLLHFEPEAFAGGSLLSRVFGKDRRSQAVASAFTVVKNILQHSPQVQGLREEPV